MAYYDNIWITIMNQTKITLAFVGRLTKEKWFDLIYDRLISLNLTNNPLLHKFTLDIYGDGYLNSKAQEIDELLPNVTYHGQVSYEKIMEVVPFFDYNLMPSRFLETFGLTAIDFALYGVPTIWFAKGGLKNLMIDDVLDMSSYPWESDYNQFEHCMRYILEDIHIWRYADLKQKTSNMYDWYSRYTWLKNFDAIVDILDK